MNARLGLALLLALAAGLVLAVLRLAGGRESAPLPAPAAEESREDARAPVGVESAGESRTPVAEVLPDAPLAADASPRRVRVLDAATGEPVAGIDVHVELGPRHVKLRTDEEGRLALEAALARPGAWITLTDGPAQCAVAAEPRRLARALAPDEELAVRARIGPTFVLRIVRPPESEAGTGHPAPCSLRLLNLEPDLPPGAERANPFGVWEEVGTADEVRLRYPVPARAIEPGLALLELRSTSRTFGARVRLSAWAGVRSLGAVVLQPSALATGRIEDARGHPLEGASVSALYRDPLPGEIPERTLSDAQGAFLLQFYEHERLRGIRVEREGYAPEDWSPVLRPGPVAGKRFQLVPR